MARIRINSIESLGTKSFADGDKMVTYRPGASADEDVFLSEPPTAIALSICQTSITHPSPDFTVSVTGTGDADLNPTDGGYVTVLNGFSSALNSGTAFTVNADGRVLINEAGAVDVTAYADVIHSSNNATVGAVFSIERGGSTIYSPRAVHGRVPNAGDIGNLSGGGAFSAQAGDIVTIALASDITGTVSIRSSSLVFRMFS